MSLVHPQKSLGFLRRGAEPQREKDAVVDEAPEDSRGVFGAAKRNLACFEGEKEV